MKRTLSLFLTLVLLCSCTLLHAASAENAVLPKDVQWGMTMETVAAITGADVNNVYHSSVSIELPLREQTISKYTATQSFIFCNDSLVVIGDYEFSSNDAEDLAYLKNALNKKYGECAPLDEEIVAAFFTEMNGGERAIETFSDCVEWKVNDDTVIWLFMVDSSMVYLLYMDASFDPGNINDFDTTGL